MGANGERMEREWREKKHVSPVYARMHGRERARESGEIGASERDESSRDGRELRLARERKEEGEELLPLTRACTRARERVEEREKGGRRIFGGKNFYSL